MELKAHPAKREKDPFPPDQQGDLSLPAMRWRLGAVGTVPFVSPLDSSSMMAKSHFEFTARVLI